MLYLFAALGCETAMQPRRLVLRGEQNERPFSLALRSFTMAALVLSTLSLQDLQCLTSMLVSGKLMRMISAHVHTCRPVQASSKFS